MTHFATFSRSPSPQDPWDPSPEQDHDRAVLLELESSIFSRMAPQLCQFEISNFNIFVDHPPKTRFGTLGFTVRRKGNLFFFIFYLFLPNDSTIAHFPFLRAVI